MLLDTTAYAKLEQRFISQVVRDRERLIERVKRGWGMYLPCVEPKGQVDYILVGMEPSWGYAESTKGAENPIAEGYRNFGGPVSWNANSPLALFQLSIERFLRLPGETCHLTDMSKGAMPMTVAAVDRDRRYERWYPLLRQEIEIVGKPSAPVIAIGKDVEKFLKKRLAKDISGRPFHTVLHYSNNASRYRKREAENDREGFDTFVKSEFGRNSRWSSNLSRSKKQLVFTYKKQFEKIRGK